ncbi:MAG: RIP metalloprotease RseP [Elainellaceae cyanobacterium]
MSVLAAIAVLALLIIVHELGHFAAARLQGIHVNRFSIGFGPILWSYQGATTEYALRAFPLGGFVGFPDDDPESTIPPSDENLLKNRPILDRAIVISAGVIANLVFAYLVFVVQFASVGVPETLNYEPGVLVPRVQTEVVTPDGQSVKSPAMQAGIQAGDVFLAIEGESLGEGDEATQKLMTAIQQSPNEPLSFTLQRGDRTLDVEMTPLQSQRQDKAIVGVGLMPNGSVDYRRPNGVGEVFRYAANEFQSTLVQTAQGFASIITNFSEVADQVAGPVKIVEQGAQFAERDATRLFPFTAIISINLAIINILPLPALDGGQLAFLLVEGVRGRPLPNRIQENVMQTGLVLLLGLGIFLIVRDTTQLEVFQRFFQ